MADAVTLPESEAHMARMYIALARAAAERGENHEAHRDWVDAACWLSRATPDDPHRKAAIGEAVGLLDSFGTWMTDAALAGLRKRLPAA